MITKEWIRDKNPCAKALKWWDKKERDPMKILNLLMKEKKYDWANWFIVRIMTYAQYVDYAVYAAEQVIDIYEIKYPNDNRPRTAIASAKKCIKNPSVKNKHAAETASDAAYYAASAAFDAASDAASAVAEAAYYAADAASAVAEAASTAYAAGAVYAADAAGAVYAAYAAMKLKILKYGIKLLKED